jgi:hypothetical protein
MKKISAVVLLFACFCSTAFALEAPTLTVSKTGVNVSMTWTSVSGATGYSLSYAPYPFTESSTIETVDLGMQTEFSVDLWDGAAFLVAVTATNGSEVSWYSNIELIDITAAAPSLVSLLLLPDSPTLNWGDLQDFTVKGLYSDGSTQTISNSQFFWYSPDTSVIVFRGDLGAGWFEAVGWGTANIQVFMTGDKSITGSTSVTVGDSTGGSGSTYYLSLPSTPDALLTSQPVLENANYEQITCSGTSECNVTLGGDITGDQYFFNFVLATSGTNTMEVEVVLNPGPNEIILATTSFTVSSDSYSYFKETVTGVNPDAVAGDVLSLRIDNNNVSILYKNTYLGQSGLPYFSIQ